ncbi:hypothetical protein A2U01_0066012 [Trifolium medium]|uniref:Uncharacterized protein n=1 Tax=Trifolium medium TaxID=97028 RepID=A0A392S766_9FABA|nr:hypothetical protein [Trifolium medium]
MQNNIIMDAKPTDSSLWKALKQVWPVIHDNEYWVVGNGKTIDAWQDCWLQPGLRIASLDISIPQHLANVKVCDLLDNNGDWIMNLVNDWLPVDV